MFQMGNRNKTINAAFPAFPADGGPLTLGLAGLGDGVDLIALVALTLEVPLVVDTHLATRCRVLTLINVCGGGERKEGRKEKKKKK